MPNRENKVFRIQKYKKHPIFISFHFLDNDSKSINFSIYLAQSRFQDILLNPGIGRMGLREILIPQDKQYFEFFTLQAENIQLASQKLLAAFGTGELSIEQARKEIRQIEHENDQIVHSIYDRLNTSFITPIDSNDILALSSNYDTIIDYIYTTINRFFLYRIVAADAAMKRFVEIVAQCAVEIIKLTADLQGLKRKAMMGSAEEIDRLENEADELLNESLGSLFEKRLDALEVMKLKEIYEFLEEITDRFEDVALLLRDLGVRYG